MKKEFYRDMARRTATIALFGELFMLLRSRSRTLSDYGFEKIEDQMLLVFLLLRVIMEKTLADRKSTRLNSSHSRAPRMPSSA